MMKRVTAILLVLGNLLAGSQAVISVHYCGGRIADTKVSLSGNIASCGMEGDEETCPMPGSNLDRHCCEDQINIAGIVNQYTAPASEPVNSRILVSSLALVQLQGLYNASNSSSTSLTSFYPPGEKLTNSVSLEIICVFRI